MPRGAKKNANQHNNRHENGIVAPGKRISKQKSNGHLNASPDGRTRENSSPLPSPSALPPTSTPETTANGSYTAAKEPSNGDVRPKYMPPHLRKKVGEHESGTNEDVSDATELQYNGPHSTNQMQEQYHRRIDVNAAKNPAVHDSSAMHLALTILKSCPLRDTLAILMVLLTLPPTFLTLTNALFAILTFVPPSGSFSTLPSLNDITQGSSGAPSFITTCITDIIGILMWLVIFSPVQALALDLTQAVVATTLGGGYSSRMGGSDSTLLCMSIVSATHLSRYKEPVLRVAQHTWIGKWLPMLEATDKGPIPSSDVFSSGWSVARGVKIFIALHILIQGLCRMVRRWYFKREYAQASSNNKKTDPEAVAGAQSLSESSSYADQVNSSISSPAEITSKTSLQSLRSAQDKVSSGKKKRKQGSYVRSQQPLWAAFAATKVTVIREYEQSQATSEAVGSNATDAKNLGSAPFALEDGRIWVTVVRPTNFYFDTSTFRYREAKDAYDDDEEGLEETGIDRSKPFYVRINGADWLSANIQVVPSSEDKSDHGQQWTGEVYGLSPAYTYQCSFVRCEDDVVIYSAIISTPSSPITEQASSSLASPQHQNLRPSSPASPLTTLKASIAAYEASVNDSSAQQRRLRKDSKASSAAIKKDLDTLQDRLNRISATDRNLQTRQLQQGQHMRQADDAIVSITSDLETIGKYPGEDSSEWLEKKSVWEVQKAEHQAIRDGLSQLKEKHHRETSTIEAEAISAQQKRERLQHRTAKLNGQHERLHSSTVEGLNEKERQTSEQHAKISERYHLELYYKEQLASLARAIQDFQYRCRQAWQQSQVLETAYDQQQLMTSHSSLTNSRPITPEGDLPGTLPHSASSAASRFPTFGSPDPHHPLSNGHALASASSSAVIPHRYENRSVSDTRHDTSYRARSTSMLSGNSIYTDFSDQDPAPPMPTRSMIEEMRQHSGSSGSVGSKGGSSSPMSPVVAPGGGGWGSGGGAVGTPWKGKGIGGSPSLG